MSRIRSKNTKPELLLFKLVDELGLLYEKHYPIVGKPDLVFPKQKLAVFVNGGFWHGRKFNMVKEGLSDFWINKIEGNIKRDRKNYKLLKKEGWRVIKIWDRDLKKNPTKEVKKIIKALNSK